MNLYVISKFANGELFLITGLEKIRAEAIMRIGHAGFYPAALAVLALLAFNSCVIVPVPWFPKNPHKEELESLMVQEIILREDILRVFGPPWAAWDEHSFIYISDRPSAYWVWGDITGNADVVGESRRDFVLLFNFDELGTLVEHEAFADTGKRDYCFSNKVCFSRATYNVPLRPDPVGDNEPEPENNRLCTVYLYRDEVAKSRTYTNYVDIHLRKDESGSFIPVGSSVAKGINLWHLEPALIYEMKAVFAVDQYPFKVEPDQSFTLVYDRPRDSRTLRFFCDPGQEYYARLAIPTSRKKTTEFTLVNESTAKRVIDDLPVLLGYYAPEMLPNQRTIR